MNHRKTMLFFVYLADAMRIEREDYYVSLVRGFQAQNDYLAKYRFQPGGALLSFLYDRLVKFDPWQFKVNCKRYQIAVEELTKAGILVPGYKIKDRGFWLFPIIVPNKVLFA
mmetsp:Transcript_26180/g.19666  ORF Transcript_26180/g.19666 Transcript_26180/m.19666 type:complete len:112 (-) Transcript_26180:323-658(-)